MTTLRPIRVLVVASIAACAGAGCDQPPNPTHAQVLTMADLEVLAGQMDPAAMFATDAGVPGGLRIDDYVKKDDAGYHLVLRKTWTEGYQSAYETGEIWIGYDEVWVQPVYVPITGFKEDGSPKLLVDPENPDPAERGWSPIFSVGADSAFYSPFWQTFYFQVPEGTSPDAYTTARKVIDSGLPLIPGPGHTMSLVPSDDVLPPEMGANDPPLGGPQGVSHGYLDGNDALFLDFGKNNFSWNDELVVEETPLFVLVYRDKDGVLQPMNVPTVAGTGPLYANRPPNVQDKVPHYGAYWRLYTVEVPPTARIFAPPIFDAKDTKDFPPALVATEYGPTVTGLADLSHWLGRVSLNATAAADMSTLGCFSTYDNLDTLGTDPDNTPEPCKWLDSQPAIERAVPPSKITRTDITVTCPFVSYAGAAFVVTP